MQDGEKPMNSLQIFFIHRNKEEESGMGYFPFFMEIEGKEERKELYFHRQLLEDKLPLSIGGGIGQSRLCMVMLHKAHIGEIQASIWPDSMRKECAAWGMPLI